MQSEDRGAAGCKGHCVHLLPSEHSVVNSSPWCKSQMYAYSEFVCFQPPATEQFHAFSLYIPIGFFFLFVFGFFCFLFLKRINDTFTVRFLPTQVCRGSDEIPPSLLPQALNRSNTAIPLTWRQLFQTPSNHCLVSQHLSTTGPKAEAPLPLVPRSAPPLPLCPPVSPNPTSYSRLCCR